MFELNLTNLCKSYLCKIHVLYTVQNLDCFIIYTHAYSELQENIIRSHAAGIGSPLAPEKTRRLLALRINVLAKGFRYTKTYTQHLYCAHSHALAAWHHYFNTLSTEATQLYTVISTIIPAWYNCHPYICLSLIHI